jgi:hypothetical protein
MKRLFKKLATFSCDRPWLVLIIIALITAIAVVGATRIQTQFTQRSMLPEGYESIATVKDVERSFGGVRFIKVMLSGKDFRSAEGASAVYKYARELEEYPGFHEDFVLGADTYLDMPARNDEFRWLLENPNPFYSGITSKAIEEYLAGEGGDFVKGKSISEDGGHALISVQINPNLKDREVSRYAGDLEDFTRDYFSSRGITAEVTGEDYINADLQNMITRDSFILGLIALVFVVLVLFLTFRKVLDVVLTLAVVLVTVAWVFGIMGFAGIKYNILGTAVIPLMLGIDVAYAIHILTRYYEERGKGSDAASSATASVITVGVAVFLAAATTMFGFLSFSISDMPPITQFGLLCLGGVFFGFILSITLLPAALVIRDRRREGKAGFRHEEYRLWDWVDRGMAKLSVLAERHRAVVWLVAGLVMVGCVVLAAGITVSADFRRFVPSDLPSYESFNRVQEVFGGQDTAFALVESEEILSPDSLREMLEFTNAVLSDPRNRDRDDPYFKADRVNSIAGILQLLNGGLPPDAGEARAAIAEVESRLGFDTSVMFKEGEGKALITFQVNFINETGQKEMAEILRDHAAEMSAGTAVTFRVSGTPVIVSDAVEKLFSTQVQSSGLALILCALLVIVIFRSLYYGLAATSVVFIAIVLELGMLRLIGWPLDIMTVMIASLVIGAGIDFGIHVAHRFREEFYENGLGPEEAINTTVRNVGTGLLSAAITTCGAFLILGISRLAPLRRFGVMTAVSLFCAMIAALLIEPSFLASIASRQQKKALKRSRQA